MNRTSLRPVPSKWPLGVVMQESWSDFRIVGSVLFAETPELLVCKENKDAIVSVELNSSSESIQPVVFESNIGPEPKSNTNLLSFHGCSAKIPEKLKIFTKCFKDNAERYLVQGVSAVSYGGSKVAIMGPSGAGKSTLLNLLTLIPNNLDTVGEITLNGHVLTDEVFRRHCVLVPQTDHLSPFLSCRESIEFALDFFHTLNTTERSERVKQLLSDFGLQSCQDTLCGNEWFQGLSGGQKRRLSLAIAIVKNPTVLFLDELTSGLDSHAAEEIMSVVSRVAKDGCIVVCTIHQPSARIFNSFDSVMLLSGGRVAYCGAIDSVATYFKGKINREPPPDQSLPEFLLETINGDFGGVDKKEEIVNILNAWEDREKEISRPANSTCNLPNTGCRDTAFTMQVLRKLLRLFAKCVA